MITFNSRAVKLLDYVFGAITYFLPPDLIIPTSPKEEIIQSRNSNTSSGHQTYTSFGHVKNLTFAFN